MPSTAPSEDTGPARHSHPAAGHGVPQALRRSGRAVLALVSAVLLVAFGYGWYNYRSLNAGVHKLQISSLHAATGSAAAAEQTTGITQNILIVGIDSRAGLTPAERQLLKVGDDDTMSTDSIIVLHVPADGSKATLISIPRDAYVDIPGGYKKNKINAAYADAYNPDYGPHPNGSVAQRENDGADELTRTVEKLTGLQIDHYVQVSFYGFYTIAKALGPIPVDLCHAVDDTHAHNVDTGQDGGSGFVMSAGHHDLTAVQALEFVRQRHNLPGGDLARVERQRYFLTAAFDKIATAGVLLNPGKLRGLIKAVASSFYVDQDFSIPQLAGQVVSLKSGNILGVTIPTTGQGPVDGVGDVDFVDPVAVRAAVARALNPSTPSARHPRRGTHSAPATSTPTSTADVGCIN